MEWVPGASLEQDGQARLLAVVTPRGGAGLPPAQRKAQMDWKKASPRLSTCRSVGRGVSNAGVHQGVQGGGVQSQLLLPLTRRGHLATEAAPPGSALRTCCTRPHQVP